VDVCGLYKLEQGMSEGPFPSSLNRPGRCPHRRVRALEFSGHLLRLPPDTASRGGPACDHVHHPLRLFLLHKNAVQTEECGATYR
jgi:hypothetical protein